MAQKSIRYFQSLAQRTSITALFSVALVLMLVGVLGFASIHARSAVLVLKENFMMDIFFKNSASSQEIKEVMNSIQAMPSTKKLHYVSREEAAKRLDGVEVESDFIEVLGDNPLLRSCDLYVKAPFADQQHLAEIRRVIMANPIVDEVSYKLPALEQFNENIMTLGLALLAFAGIILVISIILINNSVKLSLFAQRFNIKTMQLVGATHGFIRKPFLKNAIIQGFIAALLACGLVAALMIILPKTKPEFDEIKDWNNTFFLFAFLFIFGIIITTLSTFLSVNKYLRLKMDQLYD
jgi:cell division transport system permease protein